MGSPCLIPLLGLNHFDFCPFQMTDILTVPIQCMIFFFQEGGKSAFSIASSMKLQESRS